MNIDDLSSFKRSLIEGNRGKDLYLIQFGDIKGASIADLAKTIEEHLQSRLIALSAGKSLFHVCFGEYKEKLLIGIFLANGANRTSVSVEKIIQDFYKKSLEEKIYSFHYGIGRAVSDHISNSEEILEKLLVSSEKHKVDNIKLWQWHRLNRVNTYFSREIRDAQIQPAIAYDYKTKTFSVIGGELFVGGSFYHSYQELIDDIPPGEDQELYDMLVFEYLLKNCENLPGILKFNISPQTLVSIFSDSRKIARVVNLIRRCNLRPQKIRLELLEKSYEERHKSLKEICLEFYSYGITFAVDDFGVKSQSHQIILELGQMIKEFKLDPMSFKFKPEEDRTKFLDNLAFIRYCHRLASHRDAIITAEAVEDYNTLQFLLDSQVHNFQAHLFCRKLAIKDYLEAYPKMQNISESAVMNILSDRRLLDMQVEKGNIFSLAQEVGLFSGNSG